MLELILSSSTIIFVIAVLVSLSAVYNAYILRGGKLAGSQIFMALGMVSFMLSVVLSRFVSDLEIYKNISVSDSLFILGFVLLFVASLRLRASFK
ncbi:MAG: hypothetical protein Q7S45_05240 [Candidatus Curtissbacteria bacterium]|nr:hypothetical protein [Candidatus Curtissbacteria bacterium]